MRFSRITLLMSVLVLVGCAALLTAAVVNEPDDTPTTSEVSVYGRTLRLLDPAQARDDMRGAIAPEVSGRSFSRSTVSIDPLDSGQPVLVVFVSHWCDTCDQLVDDLAGWYGSADGVDRGGTGRGTKVVLVSTAVNQTSANFPPHRWLDRLGWDGPTLVDSDDSDALYAFGGTTLPFQIALKSDGSVHERASGELTVHGWDTLVDELNRAAADGPAGR